MPIDTQNSSLLVRTSLEEYERSPIYRLSELLWENRRTLLRWVLAGVALAILLRLVLPSKYQSTARVLPSDNTSDAMMIAGASAGTGMPNLSMMGDLLGIKTPSALCVAVLRSDAVLDGVINRLDLRKVYRIKDYDRTREALADVTIISDDKKSGIVSLSVTDHDPNRAAAIANAYVAELDSILQTLNTSGAHREREFLENHIEVVRQHLTDAEKQLGQFSSKNSALDIKEQGKAAFEVASRVQGELIVAQSELQGLRQIYGPDHPRVRSAEARVAQLRATAAKLGSTTAPANGDSDLLSISRLPVVGVTYADLFREVKVQEVIYEVLLKQYELSKVEEAKATPRLRIIDAGKPPAHRSGPRLLFLGAICTWGFLVIAIVIVIARSRWEEAGPDSPWKRLGLRIAADVNQIFSKSGNSPV